MLNQAQIGTVRGTSQSTQYHVLPWSNRKFMIRWEERGGAHSSAQNPVSRSNNVCVRRVPDDPMETDLIQTLSSGLLHLPCYGLNCSLLLISSVAARTVILNF